MRRGVGIAGIQRAKQSRAGFQALGSEISRTQIENLQSQLAQFRSALQKFAAAHRSDIQRNPEFRQQFAQMCAAIGVDPLAGPRRGGWWAELLGMGDWQHELGVQVVDVCVSTRARNGGLIDMAELVRMLGRMRGTAPGEITEADVERSVKSLKPLGAGYEIVVVGGRKMVRSVPRELDIDQTTVLGVAQNNGGWLHEQLLVDRTGWTHERARVALDNMLSRDGLCWLDEQDDRGSVFWVPSVMTWEDE